MTSQGTTANATKLISVCVACSPRPL